MTSTLLLSDAELGDVAASLALRMASVRSTTLANDGLEIGESFPVYVLRGGALEPGRRYRRLSPIVAPAPYWHVQLLRNDTAVAVAHVSPGEAGMWNVLNIFGWQLAPKVAAAIQWIDDQVPEEGIARMLLIPELRILAFWVEQGRRDRIVLINGAARTHGLRTERAYTVHRFLTGAFARGGVRRRLRKRPSPRS